MYLHWVLSGIAKPPRRSTRQVREQMCFAILPPMRSRNTCSYVLSAVLARRTLVMIFTRNMRSRIVSVSYLRKRVIFFPIGNVHLFVSPGCELFPSKCNIEVCTLLKKWNEMKTVARFPIMFCICVCTQKNKRFTLKSKIAHETLLLVSFAWHAGTIKISDGVSHAVLRAQQYRFLWPSPSISFHLTKSFYPRSKWV